MERAHTVRSPSPEQQEHLAVLGQYADLFVQRWDTYARQRPRSRRYYRVLRPDGTPVPLTAHTLAQHLRGEITIGFYSLDPAGLTSWSVLDAATGIAPLVAAQQQLAVMQLPAYLERSRAGGHLWTFWRDPLRPDQAKNILSPFAHDLELFPAGDVPDDDGIGLLIRAPLGIHRATGLRYPFVDAHLEPVSPGVAAGQITWLAEHVQRADPRPQLQRLEAERTTPARGYRMEYPVSQSGPIAAWRATADIREVVGHHVLLNRRGLGRCPWPDRHKHGDRHPSFQVFERTQRWWCYTEHIGGNAFDFLCRYEDLDARAMLQRLGVW